MATIFSKIKAQVKSQLETHLETPGTVADVLGYRAYALDVTPLLIITTNGYGLRLSDGAELPEITIATYIKFSGASEEEPAEAALDDIESMLNWLYSPDDGEYQVHHPYWGAVDFQRASIRPPSPFGPGTRYAEKYLQFVV